MLERRRTDPIFNLPTPLLFAHRGGAREAPESTLLAFRYALHEARADVLELDVQLTADGQMVVWHGPALDNVHISGVTPDPCKRRQEGRWEIGHFDWSVLRNAWVADPGTPHEQLPDVPHSDDRKLLLLEEFLAQFRDQPLNIELKECFRSEHLSNVIAALGASPANRPVVVASNRDNSLIRRFRKLTNGRFATNLPALPLVGIEIGSLVGILGKLEHRAVQLPYPAFLTNDRLVQQVRDRGGGTYVFLTHFVTLHGLDTDSGTPCASDLYPILDRGVDGIMTDRPKRVRQLLDAWIAQHPFP